MKKIAILLLLIIVIILGVVIITNNRTDTIVPMKDLEASSFVSDQLNTVKGVTVRNVRYDSDLNRIQFTMSNKRKDKIYYGDEVLLEKKQNGAWYIVPYSGEVGFLNILNYLDISDKKERTINSDRWIALTPGEYRIIIEVSLREGYQSLQAISGKFKVK